MKAARLFEFLEELAPLHLQENFDNAGLIVGNADTEIRGVLFCLDVTEEVIEEAIALQCNVVVSHHPIVFTGLKKITGQHHVERTVIKAIQNGILLYAVHTNLDNVLHHGVNQHIALRLGLKNIEILHPKPGTATIGSGVLANVDPPVSVEKFFEQLKQRMQLTHFKYTKNQLTSISRVAICGGSGAFLIHTAKQAKAQIFITADVKYHDFFESSAEFCIVDIGHYESEKFTSELLYGLVAQNFSNFASHCSKIITNPVKYH